MAKTRVIKVHPQNPDLDALAEAAAILRAGKAIAFPTETVYGLGALSRFNEAIEGIYKLKGRDHSKPLAYHVANYEFLELVKPKDPRTFLYLAKIFWPGPLTLIAEDISGAVLGFRMPQHTVARILIELCGEPLMATSANPSGGKSPLMPAEVLSYFDGKIDLLIDSGKCELANDSTIVDITKRPFRILRKGAIHQEVEKELSKLESGEFPKFKVLMVCTGNTCRSPMAEAWFRNELRKQGVDSQFKVDSCGIFAYKNMPATQEAIAALEEVGIDLSSHLAKPLTPALVKDADQIYVMTYDHERFILQRYPHLAGRVKVLQIDDPIGLRLEVYRECFLTLKRALGAEVTRLAGIVGDGN